MIINPGELIKTATQFYRNLDSITVNIKDARTLYQPDIMESVLL